MLEKDEDDEDEDDEDEDDGDGSEMRGAVPPEDDDGGEEPGGENRLPPSGVVGGPACECAGGADTSGGGAPRWAPGVGTELRPPSSSSSSSSLLQPARPSWGATGVGTEVSSSSSLLQPVRSMTTTRGRLLGRPDCSLDEEDATGAPQLREVDATDELGLLIKWVSFLAMSGDQEPSSWNCTSQQSLGAFVVISMNRPSMTRDEKVAGRSHTGQIQVGFFSFICRYSDASKHCRCEHVSARHGMPMRILPSGHMRDPRRLVVAISESGSCCNFSLIMAVVWSGLRIPVAFNRCSRVAADSFRTRYTPMV